MLNSLGLSKPAAATKVCVAMSGGVDSSAAAALLKEQGYQVFGLTMDLLQEPYAPRVSSVADAATVAAVLGIEHHYLNLRQQFRKKVVDYFADTYLAGQTPSPCIMCNKFIKLGLLADKARELGADILVTGHYAGIRLTPAGVELHKASDLSRDQSYFLFGISQSNLQMLRCPLAAYTKEQTREIARRSGLEIYKKSDSQDICFVSEGRYADLIRQLRPHITSEPGNIVDLSGHVLGRHKGLLHYTVGQRRGLGIGGPHGILYVIKLDIKNNTLIVGPQEALQQKRVFLNNVNWLAGNRPQNMELQVKLRSRQKAVSARLEFGHDNTAQVTLFENFCGVAPGQGCCFYQGTRVMGGGIITEASDFTNL